MLTVDAALRLVLENAQPLESEEVPLAECVGRVLAENVAADVDMPPFDRAMMDGYALRAADARLAPVALRVAGEVRAGQHPSRALEPGQAVRVMTGAPLPPGADAVQQVEKTRPEAGQVVLLEPVEPGQNVAPLASEVRAGQSVLAQGLVLDPSAVAVLASFGVSRPRVGRRPSLALLVTGDELVDVNERPHAGRIRNSNGYALAAQAASAGAQVRALGVVRDEQPAIEEALRRGLAADVLAVSGGVSEGVYDLVEPALARCGVELLFTKVAIKPGAPLVFGRRGATLVFGLPGNPVSAQVTFDVFVRAALLRLQGARSVSRPRVLAELLAPLRNRSRRTAYLPVRLRFADGRFAAHPLPSRGSADVVAHAGANALVILAPERELARAGERAEALLLGNFLERDGAA